MKEINFTDIRRNVNAEVDYYGRDGRILIKKGVLIDETLLNAINRRNISKFYIQEEGEDIKKLLSLQSWITSTSTTTSPHYPMSSTAHPIGMVQKLLLQKKRFPY